MIDTGKQIPETLLVGISLNIYTHIHTHILRRDTGREITESLLACISLETPESCCVYRQRQRNPESHYWNPSTISARDNHPLVVDDEGYTSISYMYPLYKCR